MLATLQPATIRLTAMYHNGWLRIALKLTADLPVLWEMMPIHHSSPQYHSFNTAERVMARRPKRQSPSPSPTTKVTPDEPELYSIGMGMGQYVVTKQEYDQYLAAGVEADKKFDRFLVETGRKQHLVPGVERRALPREIAPLASREPSVASAIGEHAGLRDGDIVLDCGCMLSNRENSDIEKTIWSHRSLTLHLVPYRFEFDRIMTGSGQIFDAAVVRVSSQYDWSDAELGRMCSALKPGGRMVIVWEDAALAEGSSLEFGIQSEGLQVLTNGMPCLAGSRPTSAP